MNSGNAFPAGVSSMRGFALLLAAGLWLSLASSRAMAQNFIPATRAFDSPGCNGDDLGDTTDLARANPEWKAIIIDPNHPLPNNPPTILEGFVAFPPSTEASKDQAPAEVSEEELPWNHYTHDYTFKVVPDPPYQNLLASWNRYPGATIPGLPDPFCAGIGGTFNGTDCIVPPEQCPDLSFGDTCHRTLMEVEWENASVMKVNDDDDRKWGALPEFAWPSSGDRVWVLGRWIFDCGHAGVPKAAPVRQYVKYDTEIHPPRALVTFRLNHPALTSLNLTAPQSWLPVTCEPVVLPPDVKNTGPTQVPLTEADIFISGNGGGANDYCSLVADCPDSRHTGPIIPVNDRNYVFDIYPPGTDYLHPLPNGTFPVTAPVADAALQWRMVDQSGQIPDHTCGSDPSSCASLPMDADHVLFCLLDDTTKPPDQTETTCPSRVPANPTRLRIILKFLGSNANYFAQSLLLGWDDVPKPGNTLFMRTFRVSLHKFTVEENGEHIGDSDWRLFVDVGGQWRYLSALYDRDSDGQSICNGADALTETANNDCYRFDNTPWTVSVMYGDPIHVAVGGFESDGVDGNFCRDFAGTSCSPGIHGYFDLGFENDDRIGTYEFDLKSPHDYAWTAPDGTPISSFTTHPTDDGEYYTVEFTVDEVPRPTPPASNPLQVGDPHFGSYVSSVTPFVLSSSDPDAEGFQYRFRAQGAAPPTYASALPFPVHWTRADLASGAQSLSVYISGTGLADGAYELQFSANSFANLLEPRTMATAILDNTPPVAGITSPTATQYGHSDPLPLNYSVSDGSGSGVKSFTPAMDGQTAAQFGASLDPGQTIYLYSMSLGSHTFSVDSLDNVNNAGTSSVVFTIAVTPESLKGDVNDLLGLGCIDKISPSLIAKIDAAQKLIGKGQIQAAINILSALISEVQAQAGKHIDATCQDPSGRTFDPVQLLIGDIQYLQGILAGQVKPKK